MNKYLKYLKVLAYIFIPVLILNLLLSTFYYFNIIGDKSINFLNLLIISISMLIGGIYIGNKSSKRGWLEGLKVGIIVIILLIIINLILNSSFDIKKVIYYFIILVSSILGSMIGINKKKEK